MMDYHKNKKQNMHVHRHKQNQRNKSDANISIHLCSIEKHVQWSKDRATFCGNTRDDDGKKSNQSTRGRPIEGF